MRSDENWPVSLPFPSPARNASIAFQQRARLIIRAYCGRDAGDLTPVAGGEKSQAFTFSDPGRGALVLRVNPHCDYSADIWAHHKFEFEGTSVPVPEIMAAGADNHGYWAISRRAVGSSLYDLPQSAQLAAVPAIVNVLGAIHGMDVTTSHGYGPKGDDGNARFLTWEDCMHAAIAQTAMVLEERSAVAIEQATHDALRTCLASAASLVPSVLPDQRVLLHGDFNPGNLICHGRQITAVVDWVDVAYGDPWQEVAWVDFWLPHLNFVAAYEAQAGHCDSNRIVLYHLLMGARALGSYVETGQSDRASAMLNRVRSLLGARRLR